MQNNTFSTSFVGQNLIKLSAVDSTNNFLKSLLSKSEPLPEGTVIMADDQFAGRGMQQNVWYAEPEKNLTFSILLNPIFLSVEHQFFLNIAVSVAINKVLSKLIPKDIAIKWPNDIYYQEQKIGGILIENTIAGNSIKNAVIGVGLNVNQHVFAQQITSKVTSLALILKKDLTLEWLLGEILEAIEKSYQELKDGNYRLMKDRYIQMLYLLDISALYRQNGEVFEGIIRGITNAGMLEIERFGEISTFGLKEIEFLQNIN